MKGEKERAASIRKKRTQAKRDKDECDRLFSLIVRARGACETCGSRANLQCSHIYSRRYTFIRCDELNAMCQCARCHRRWHDRPVEMVAWLRDCYPADHLELLAERARVVNIKVDWGAKRAELAARLLELS